MVARKNMHNGQFRLQNAASSMPKVKIAAPKCSKQFCEYKLEPIKLQIGKNKKRVHQK